MRVFFAHVSLSTGLTVEGMQECPAGIANSQFPLRAIVETPSIPLKKSIILPYINPHITPLKELRL